MTTCSEIRDLLLDATPAELRGEGEGALAAHLRSCAACRRRAALLLRADEALNARLDVAPALDVEAILARAAEAPVELSWRARAASAVRGAAAARRSWVPLVAAATLAGLLLVSRGPAPEPLPVAGAAEAPPLVEATTAAGVAILETENPNITVLWFFEQGT